MMTKLKPICRWVKITPLNLLYIRSHYLHKHIHTITVIFLKSALLIDMYRTQVIRIYTKIDALKPKFAKPVIYRSSQSFLPVYV